MTVPAPQQNETLRQEAMAWRVRRHAGELSPSEEAAFNTWLTQSDEHRDTYAGVDEFWAAAGHLGEHPRFGAIRSRAEAQVAGAHQTRRAIAASIAAVVLGIGAVGGYLYVSPKPLANQSFRTAVGQQATVTLPDGSQVTLNTDTMVHTVADDGRRLVYLDKGQAFFKVAKDRRHPFIVTAAGRTVTALGTAFDVRIDGGELKVVLVEGKVRVQAAAPARPRGAPAASDDVLPSRVTEMSPGSQLVATSDTDWKLTPTDVSRETSWLKGQLVIDDEPLSDVVEEVNRYSTRKIVIADAELAKRHVSGNFAPGDVHGFAMILQAAHV
ncbi:MAG TPA: FecR domain-containing protein, partial [Caulobacteraceae bacterium]|nr:FecR domain-containing protein [Caulobacteraceae bacterium]